MPQFKLSENFSKDGYITFITPEVVVLPLMIGNITKGISHCKCVSVLLALFTACLFFLISQGSKEQLQK